MKISKETQIEIVNFIFDLVQKETNTAKDINELGITLTGIKSTINVALNSAMRAVAESIEDINKIGDA